MSDGECKIMSLRFSYSSESSPLSGKWIRCIGNADVVFLDIAVNDAMSWILLQRHQAWLESNRRNASGALERVTQCRGIA